MGTKSAGGQRCRGKAPCLEPARIHLSPAKRDPVTWYYQMSVLILDKGEQEPETAASCPRSAGKTVFCSYRLGDCIHNDPAPF